VNAAEAARSACCRAVKPAGAARDVANSLRRAASRAHRRRVIQPAAAVAPMMGNGLTRERTAAAVIRSMAHSTNARAIAGPL